MIGLVITIGLTALCTVVALNRVERAGKLAYQFAVVVNEIPHVAGAYLMVIMAIAWVSGDLQGVTGVVLVLVVTATLVGLVELARRAMAGRDAVRRGLASGGIDPVDVSAGNGVRPFFAPFPIRPWTVSRKRGIAYGRHRRQRLDVYRRRGRQEAGPVLVYLHGGGYFTGSRHWEARGLLHHYASRGWVCISAGYRLRPGAGFEEHLADARAAVAWAHAHAAEHGGDASTLVMAGSSAGAHLTAICALTQHQQPDPAASRIDAAVGFYGYYGRYYGRGSDETPISSPLDLDATQAPPFFLAHGDHDSYVPVPLARDLDRHLRSQSERDVVYIEMPWAQHGFDLFCSWRYTAVIDGLEAWLIQLKSGQRQDLGAVIGDQESVLELGGA